ncbi:hypothetical protein ACPWT1_13910 [Ramlibacter sp. MMS24-I3-19]|uniref:hypothetical protein n=1 Tax=Ramlibacter sp. MMS24-I3-19 TaxID=3416606 RepID=UPI003D01EABF
MNDNKTSSMLQRLPVILAVTAASYGLQLPANASRPASVAKAQSSKGAQTLAVARKSVSA